MDEREGALQGVLHAHLLAHGNAPDDGASSASASTLPVLKTTVTSVSPNPNIIYVMDISFLHHHKPISLLCARKEAISILPLIATAQRILFCWLWRRLFLMTFK